jgi:ribonucleoside-triphosphate reductase (thioredoxin)
VQTQHIEKLPEIKARSKKKVKIYQVPDSIEGWSDAYAVLMSSYFVDNGVFPEYKGCQVHFDFSLIRPKGAKISGGFKAPGPDGLRSSLIKCEALLDAQLTNKEQTKVDPIVAYDLVMHMSDAVLSGGVRRSATICMFSKDDTAMLNAKTGSWFIDNPQRGRSNNSAMILRDDITRTEWADIMKSVKAYGEPGFIFTDNLDITFNPCVEVGMYPKTKTGESGWQMCNLTEINGSKLDNQEVFNKACRAGAILGTLQAGYTKFKYLSSASQIITEEEALIGVGITGWMNNPWLFEGNAQNEGAEVVKEMNALVAELIGINQAARCTVVKPSGNASVILGTASGIHGEHAPMYFRNVQVNEQDEVGYVISKLNPKMIEKSVWSSNGTDNVVSFPIITSPNSIYKSGLLGVKQLEYVKHAQQNWIESGTNHHRCRIPEVRHNVSNTITVEDWDEVEQYIFDNRKYFAGISLLSTSGDKSYAQAPFTEVFTAEQITAKYGAGAMLASGLVVEGLRAFNQNLWAACDTLQGHGQVLTDNSDDLLKRDWIRRANKFSKNFFGDNTDLMQSCLKDVFNLHKWESIRNNFVDIDFSKELTKQTYTEVDTLAGAACAGGSCEVVF